MEDRRIGGKKNGRVRTGSDSLPDLDSARAVRDAVATNTDVYAGKLSPPDRVGLGPLLMHLQLRVSGPQSLLRISDFG
jgi:hypothetical protein